MGGLSVPGKRSLVTTTDIVSGATVRGPTWEDVGNLYNWTYGRGGMLIPITTSHGVGMTDQTLNFRVRPRYQALERYWCLTVYGDDVGTFNVYTPSGGTATTYPMFDSVATAQPIVHKEVLSSQSDATSTPSIRIASTITHNLVAIGCWEVPRAALAEGGSDKGIDTAKLRRGQPIMRDALEAGVLAVDESLLGRRALYHLPCHDASHTRIIVNSGTYVEIVNGGVPVLARKVFRGQTTDGTRIRGAIYAYCDSGTTGEYRVTSTVNGASASQTFTSTSPTWINERTPTFDAEDLASTDGRQTAASPVTDYANIEVRRTAGTGDIHILSASIWET